MITLDNVSSLQKEYSLISKTKIRGNNSRPRYRLDVTLEIQLSNGMNIEIPKGFQWDLSTVPRFAWSILAPDGDFELAYLIHDYLWINKEEMATHFKYYDMNFNQKFTDDEMLKWTKVTNGTKKISIRNIDNYTRYYSVRLLGWLVWDGYINIK
jgi:hypothetical protein